MTLPIAFNDTPPVRPVPVPVKDLERQRIIRQALIAFELGEAAEQAAELDELVIRHESERQRLALELALAELGRGNLDTVKLLVKEMKDTV